MKLRHLTVLVLATPVLGACAFLIDFDELQKGGPAKATGGAGGQMGETGGGPGHDASTEAQASGGAGGGGGGAGGTASDAGDGGGNCPTGCDDADPCTIDACTASGCTHTYTPGVVLDGLSEKVVAPTFHRVTMSAQKPKFYLSALESTASGTDVIFNAFGVTDKTLAAGQQLSKLGSFNGRVPVSAAGIAAGTNSLVLNAFVAMGQTIGQAAQVWELTVDPTLGVKSSAPAASDDNYAAAATTYPVAWSPSGSEVYAAWPGATSGVFLHRAGDAAEAAGASPVFGAAAGKVTDVAPLAAGSLPAVLYINSKANVQAFGQLLPLPLGGCDGHPGTFGGAISAYSQVDGIWLAGWTKVLTGGGWVAELKPVVCGSSGTGVGCLGSPQCERTDQTYQGIRNPAFTFVTRPIDPVGRVFELAALPFVDTVKNSAGIGLELMQIDFNASQPDASATAVPITPSPVPIVVTKPGANLSGPDLPALAFLEPHHLAVAWIQPGEAATQELHIERHKICFPKK